MANVKRGYAVIFIVIMAVVFLIFVEAGSYVFSLLKYSAGYSDVRSKRAEVVKRLPVESDEADGGFAKRASEGQFYGRRELHPYFGYTFLKNSRRSFNNYGFVSPHDYPYKSGEREFVVGIFGGSLALQLYNDPTARKKISEAVKVAVADKGYSLVTVLSFSQGGWKEPQTLFALLYYLNTVDMAIVLDGFNDISQLNKNSAALYPSDFPWSSVWLLLSDNSYSVEELSNVHRLRDITKRIRATTLSVDESIFGSFMVAHLYWHMKVDSLNNEAAAIRSSLESSGAREAFTKVLPDNYSPSEAIEAYLKKYKSFKETAFLAARANGVPLVHFIQPNQYVKGSKLYSDEEREKFLSHSGIKHKVALYYPVLRNISASLSRSGYPSYDLSMIFKDIGETLYVDTCCHLNSTGVNLMARSMLDSISMSGAFKEALTVKERAKFRRSPLKVN